MKNDFFLCLSKMSESNIAYVFRVTFYTSNKEKASSVYFLNAEDTRFALDIDSECIPVRVFYTKTTRDSDVYMQAVRNSHKRLEPNVHHVMY